MFERLLSFMTSFNRFDGVVNYYELSGTVTQRDDHRTPLGFTQSSLKILLYSSEYRNPVLYNECAWWMKSAPQNLNFNYDKSSNQIHIKSVEIRDIISDVIGARNRDKVEIPEVDDMVTMRFRVRTYYDFFGRRFIQANFYGLIIP